MDEDKKALGIDQLIFQRYRKEIWINFIDSVSTTGFQFPEHHSMPLGSCVVL